MDSFFGSIGFAVVVGVIVFGFWKFGGFTWLKKLISKKSNTPFE